MKHERVIIRKVQLTEKGSALSETQNKYFFEVASNANKHEIKDAVQALFGVSVKDVNTMRYMGKRKRERTIRYGKRSDWKRAVVTLKAGEKIDFT
ncbi:MAG: 50S ribosomal protein L23 [Verrucomicrobia bacterium]|nr:50S ribosomal protein L23 [Verrucomicrobiota bacterium]